MDKLDEIAVSVKKTIHDGYYLKAPNAAKTGAGDKRNSLADAIKNCKNAPIIAELKPASPSAGVIKKDFDAKKIISEIKDTGISGLSVLTEPRYFSGSLASLCAASESGIPTLMKDMVVDASQMDAAKKSGACAVLLIVRLFDRGHAPFSVDVAVEMAHERGLEAVLEAGNIDEYERAQQTKADMIGINNRDLSTFEVDLNTTAEILESCGKDRTVISMSGISTADDVRQLARAGADAFLVGTSVMASADAAAKLRELVGAIER